MLLALSRLGVLLVGFGLLLALGFGLWLVHLGDWGYDAGWVDAALALLAAVIVLGAIGGQRPKRARRLATAFDSRGGACERPAARAARRPCRTRCQPSRDGAPARGIALMVFKPGAPRA